jgi:hypothetical protein
MSARILNFISFSIGKCSTPILAFPRRRGKEPVVFTDFGQRIQRSFHRVGDFLRETEVEDALRRRQLLWFDTLGRDGDHLSLQFLIYCA